MIFAPQKRNLRLKPCESKRAKKRHCRKTSNFFRKQVMQAGGNSHKVLVFVKVAGLRIIQKPQIQLIKKFPTMKIHTSLAHAIHGAMKSQLRILGLAAIATLTAAPAAMAQQLIVNGDFSAGSANWTFTSGPLGGNATIAVIPDVSSVNTNVLSLADANPDGGGNFVPSAEQAFASQTGSLTLSFDFTFAQSGGFPYIAQLTTSGYSSVLQINLNADRVEFNGFSGVNTIIADMNAATDFDDWFRLTTTVNLATGTATGSVLNLTTSTNITQNWGSSLNILGGSGQTIERIRFGDPLNTQVQATAYFDNVSIVPEPSSFALLAGALAGLAALRRRRRN